MARRKNAYDEYTTHIRIHKLTKERLDAWIANQLLAKQYGTAPKVAGELGHLDRYTHDEAIQVLLERDMRHKARKRKAARTRQERAGLSGKAKPVS